MPATDVPVTLMNWLAVLEFDVALLIIIIPVMVVSALGALVTRSIFGRAISPASTVGQSKVGAAAEIYAVVLGFIIVFGFSEFQDTKRDVLHEATLLDRLIAEASIEPSAETPIKSAVVTYVTDVVERDWPLMSFGASSIEAEASARALDAEVRHLAGLVSPLQSYRMLSLVDNLAARRTERLSSSPDPVVAAIVFQVLAVGIVLAIVTGWFVRGPSVVVHMVLSAMISGAVVTLMILSAQLLYPFAGSVAISSEPFVAVLETARL